MEWGRERVKTRPRVGEKETAREREGEKRKHRGLERQQHASRRSEMRGWRRARESERETTEREKERDHRASNDACVLCLYRLGGKGHTYTHKTCSCTCVRKEGKRGASRRRARRVNRWHVVVAVKQFGVLTDTTCIIQ